MTSMRRCADSSVSAFTFSSSGMKSFQSLVALAFLQTPLPIVLCLASSTTSLSGSLVASSYANRARYTFRF